MEKRRWLTRLGASLFILFAGTCLVASQQRGTSGSSTATFEQLTGVISRNCAQCHFKGSPAASTLALDDLISSPQRSLSAEPEWRKVYARAVVARSMPPRGSGPEMSDADRSVVEHWIDNAFGPPPPLSPDSAGRTLPRLTNYEYNRSIRDLFGFDFDVEGFLQKDNTADGFTNNAAVMFMTEDRVRQYWAASQFVSQTLLGINDNLAFKRRQWTAQEIFAENPNRGILMALGRWFGDRINRVKKGQRAEEAPKLELTSVNDRGTRVRALDMEQTARFTIRHEFPISGNYSVIVKGASNESRENAAIKIAIDGLALPLSVDLLPRSQGLQTYTLPIRIARGKHSLLVSVPTKAHALLSALEIEGPIVTGATPTDQRMYLASKLPCVERGAPTAQSRDCAGKTIRELASKAFRAAPLSDSETQVLLAPFQAAIEGGKDFSSALSLSIQAVLMDPRFLYRIESAAPRVTDFEFATRLSYFLWGSLPDDELRNLAGRQALVNAPGTIRAQVSRMLADPRADALIDAFADGWLGFSGLKNHVVDTKVYTGFDEELRLSMLEETRTYLKSFFEGNQAIPDLIGSKTLFVNDRLARHYGIPNVEGPQFRRIEASSSERGGLLTQGSILTVTSNSYRTSVVKRGYWILDRVLCETVDQPPGNVPALEESPADGLTLRQEMERHRADPTCAFCHRSMDPLGFSLENYDGVGSWRTRDGGGLIDASAELPGSDGVNKFKDFAQLRDFLKNDSRIPACVTKKLMTYAMGRTLSRSDEAEIKTVTSKTRANGHRIQDVITEIVLSDTFRNRPQ